MKLLVVSDNHGEKALLEQLKVKYANEVDALIHCGDSELAEDDEAMADWIVVRGNCDYDDRYVEEKVIELSAETIFITHGHLYNVKMNELQLFYKSKEVGATAVFFGHTHLLGAEQIEGIIFVNPGSLSYPRGGNEKTYALIEKSGSTWDVRFYNQNHEELTSLRKILQ